jgi:hypothetical protein
MALSIQIGIINNDADIIVVDNTGDYNAISNPGGWNDTVTPNTASYRSNVTVVDLNIFLPGSTTTIGNSALYSTTFFNVGTNRAYNVFTDPSTVVPTFALTDGVWKYVFTFSILSSTVIVTKYSLRVNNLVCSIGKLALGNMDINNYAEAKLLYDRMVQAFNCEEYTLAQELYEEINFLLSDSDCNAYSIGGCNC